MPGTAVQRERRAVEGHRGGGLPGGGARARELGQRPRLAARERDRGDRAPPGQREQEPREGELDTHDRGGAGEDEHEAAGAAARRGRGPRPRGRSARGRHAVPEIGMRRMALREDGGNERRLVNPLEGARVDGAVRVGGGVGVRPLLHLPERPARERADGDEDEEGEKDGDERGPAALSGERGSRHEEGEEKKPRRPLERDGAALGEMADLVGGDGLELRVVEEPEGGIREDERAPDRDRERHRHVGGHHEAGRRRHARVRRGRRDGGGEPPGSGPHESEQLPEQRGLRRTRPRRRARSRAREARRPPPRGP